MPRVKSARLPVAPFDAPPYLSGRECRRLMDIVEELHLLLGARGVPIVRGSVCAAILELARIASGKHPLPPLVCVLIAGGVPL